MVNNKVIDLEEKTAQEVLEIALNEYGDKIVLASSFGAEDVALVDMAARIRDGVNVFVLDTGYLFQETHNLIEKIKEKYKINLKIYEPDISVSEMEMEYGVNLFSSAPEKCCEIRKITILKRALLGVDAWITGIRRDQSLTRANAKKMEFDVKFDIMKFNPIVDWTSDQVWEYVRSNNIPYNELHDKNYPSIGCYPCTKAVNPGDDPRSGRWAGTEKTECGLHIPVEGEER